METTAAQPSSARHLLAALVASTFLPIAAHAQQTDAQRIQDLERKLEKSMELIERLNTRVNQLEHEKGATAPAPARASAATAASPTPAAQEARIEALERSVTQMATSMGGHDEHGGTSMMGMPLHGFTDVDYEHSGRPTTDGRKAGFTLGNLDFYLTPSWGRVKMLGELNFEVNREGGLDTDLERLQLGYATSDALTIWMGRFYTPYGYWNAAFHHGAQMQTSVLRPRFIDFEDKGGIVPAHSVGMWATGHVPLGPGKLTYDAYFANGSRIVDGTLDFNQFRDDNPNKGVGGNVGYAFFGRARRAAGGAARVARGSGRGTTGETLQARTRLAFAGGYFYADLHDWEGIGEYYRFNNADLSGGTGTHTSWAGFLQLGKTLWESWTPYYRWEEGHFDQTDPYFAAQNNGNSYKRQVVGVRYTLNPNSVLKIEGSPRSREMFGPAWVS